MRWPDAASRWRRAELTLAGLLIAVLLLDLACPLSQPAADSTSLTVLAADGTPLRSWASASRRHPRRCRRATSKPCCTTRTAGSAGTRA